MSADVALSELRSRHLCIDLVNTVDLRLSAFDDQLASYDAVVALVRDAASAEDADRLRAEALRRPDDAVLALERVRAFREALFPVLSAAARHVPAPEAALSVVDEALADPTAAVALRWTGDGWAVGPRDPAALTGVVGLAARSAAVLLTSPALARLKECPGSPGRACGWLFVDATKNGSRAWCTATRCGNRTRAHRRYHRRAASD